MAAVTVTLGSHQFEVPPEATKRRSLNVALHEIPDGTDKLAIMGRTNKEIHLGTVEVTKSDYDDLYTAYLTEAELTFDIPDFEESKLCRISRFISREIEGVPETSGYGYYEVDISVVLTT